MRHYPRSLRCASRDRLPEASHAFAAAAAPATDAALRTAIGAGTWVPAETPGKSSRLLACLPGDRGFVEWLRMAPGVAMPPHRHTGETHVFHLAGARRLPNGEVIGPGAYSYEPAGNVDAWEVVGDEPLLALVIVMGTVEFLGADGSVRAVVSAATQREQHQRWLEAQRIHPPLPSGEG
jgi:quercetin dioxygenase-like cupin family protein